MAKIERKLESILKRVEGDDKTEVLGETLEELRIATKKVKSVEEKR